MTIPGIILSSDLTVEQKNVVVDPATDILAIACAGSGKSRTLAYRIAWQISQGVDPKSIVAFTFTDKAADSIKMRVATALARFGLEPTMLGRLYIGTIHQFCKGLLSQIDARYRQFDVLDDNRLRLFLMSRYPELQLQTLRQQKRAGYFRTIREVAHAWSTAHDELIDLSAIGTLDPSLGSVLQQLDHSLDHANFLDFSLMIRIVVDRLIANDPETNRALEYVEHLLVDEYQDVNPLQQRLIELIRNRCTSLIVVGDDDQGIYAWRGADIGNIMNFGQRHPSSSQHTLSCNFRSIPLIVENAERFASAELGANRFPKNPTSGQSNRVHELGALWFGNRISEAEWVAARIETLLGSAYNDGGERRGLTPADFAILMRSTKVKEQDGITPRHGPFTDTLDQLGIPYILEAGGGAFDRPHVSVLRESLELLRDGSPDRNRVLSFVDAQIRTLYPYANIDRVTNVYSNWGRQIHTPRRVERRRVYPQQLLHDLLYAYGVAEAGLNAGIMADIGLLSRMLQDVETVYVSIDEAARFRDVLNFLQNVAEEGYQSTSEAIVLRPDAVTVSTVHKAKGLEYPVIFVVDVERQRFPGRRSRYDGWLPKGVIATAVARGAYGNDREQEARLFYTALTRAERFLYVTGSASLPGGRSQRRESPFSARLDDPRVKRDIPALTTSFRRSPQQRRIDEDILPTTFSEIRYYLRCPRDYLHRHVWGFSPPITEVFGFGQSVHASIGKLHQRFEHRPPTSMDAENVTRDVFHLKHVPQSNDAVSRPGPYERARDAAVDIAIRYARDFEDDFHRSRQLEVIFEIPLQDCVVQGAIDLLLRTDTAGNLVDASVIDFKSMEGGAQPVKNRDLDWTELSLQVQLYARAATEVLSETASTGAVHLLQDGQRIDVPVDANSIQAAIDNLEWAVARIVAGEFPMRPSPSKCEKCDWKTFCPKQLEPFDSNVSPPPAAIPSATSGTYYDSSLF